MSRQKEIARLMRLRGIKPRKRVSRRLDRAFEEERQAEAPAPEPSSPPDPQSVYDTPDSWSAL